MCVSVYVTALMAVTDQRVSVSSISPPPGPGLIFIFFLRGLTSWLNRLCDVNSRPAQAIPNGFVLFVADPHDTSLSLVFTAGAHSKL